MGTAAAIVGSAVIGGGASYLASKKSADAQENAAERGAQITREEMAQQRQFFDEAKELQRPGRQVGTQALNSLSVLFGLEPAVPSGVSNQQVIDAQVAREVPQDQAQDFRAQQTFQQTLDAVPQNVRAEYERLIDGRIDLPGDNARQRPQFRQRLEQLRSEYPSLTELDQQFASSGRLHRDVPPAQADTLASAARGIPVAGASPGPMQRRAGVSTTAGLPREAGRATPVEPGLVRAARMAGNGNRLYAGGSPTFDESAGGQTFDMDGNQVGGTAGAPSLPVAGQETQLQRTGFLDEPNNPAPTREGVLQSLEDFPVSEFLREQGMKGIQDSAAARGGLSSGRTLRALTEFNQNFAQANAIQPFIGGLQGLAGVGQQAAAGQQNAVTNAAAASRGGASDLANLALLQGNARASAFQGANDAFQGTLGNLTTAYLLRDQI